MEIYTILFLVLAVVIIVRLRGVLGRRTGTERPPVDPFPRRDQSVDPGNGNVVPLPQRGMIRPVEAPMTQPEPINRQAEALDAIAPPGTPLAAALGAVLRIDRSFDALQFLTGAKAAYEMIVNAFARGDRQTLKPLLSKEVFDGFDHAIAEREKSGHRVESTFVGLDKAEVVEAATRANTAQITVRFVSKLIQATRAADGSVVDGDPAKVTEVTDVWTFARDVTSRDPNWRLIATEAA